MIGSLTQPVELSQVGLWCLSFLLIGAIIGSGVALKQLRDRIIRLEMQFLLERLLIPDHAARARELTPSHLLTLKRIQDVDLAVLVQSVLDE